MTKLDSAIKFATDRHAGQTRKLTLTPYILHPLEAATVAASLTSDEDVICAALLHDTIEDANVKESEIRELFGDKVADLVAAETENKRKDIPPENTWKTRKEETLKELFDTKDVNVKILWLSDKLSNMRSLFSMYLKIGDDVWKSFHTQDKKSHEWYYRSVEKALSADLGETSAFKEYQRLLDCIFG